MRRLWPLGFWIRQAHADKLRSLSPGIQSVQSCMKSKRCLLHTWRKRLMILECS